MHCRTEAHKAGMMHATDNTTNLLGRESRSNDYNEVNSTTSTDLASCVYSNSS